MRGRNSHGQTPWSYLVHHHTQLPEQIDPQEHQRSSTPHAHSPQSEDDLYNFKGFMYFCFGTPGVSPNWCSKYIARLTLYKHHQHINPMGIHGCTCPQAT